LRKRIILHNKYQSASLICLLCDLKNTKFKMIEDGKAKQAGNVLY